MKEETIDALELLRSQHDEVEELFEDIEDADGQDKLDLFTELADKLAAHVTIEEKLFYPSVMADETCDLLLEATEEHLTIKRTLADLLEMEVDHERFDAKLKVLKDLMMRHAHEEEEALLFPKVKRLLDANERAALGNELLAMFEMLIEQEPRKVVPAETVEAAPLPM
jgi:hypothetical protein